MKFMFEEWMWELYVVRLNWTHTRADKTDARLLLARGKR